MKKNNLLVGDEVEFKLDEKTNEYVIIKSLERKNQLIRPFVCNITNLFIVLSCEPIPDLLLIDKLILNAKMNNITPILVINKIDIDKTLINVIKKEYEKSNVLILEVSSKTGENINKIENLLKNNINAFAGQSGTGKTSLINRICNINRKVNVLSEKIMRGKNTTTNAELIVLEKNTFVLDTAGFTKLEFEKLEPELIKFYYPEFENNNCNFNNCNHIFEGEKYCSILRNIGKYINKNRYERYKQIFLESKENWSKRYD